jgi:PGF-pre-PGF domain-containing protein
MKNAITWASTPTGAAQPTPSIQDILRELAHVESEQVSSISAQTPTSLTFEKAEITEITLTLAATINDVAVVVDNLEEKPTYIPTEPVGTIYRYYDISTNLEDPNKLSSATIEFKVEKSWINANGINSTTIKLLKYLDGQWIQLTTQKVREDGAYAYYSATIPGFSVFAIAGEKAAGTIVPGISLMVIVVAIIVVIAMIALAMFKLRK